jgi:hypothetical protein
MLFTACGELAFDNTNSGTGGNDWDWDRDSNPNPGTGSIVGIWESRNGQNRYVLEFSVNGAFRYRHYQHGALVYQENGTYTYSKQTVIINISLLGEIPGFSYFGGNTFFWDDATWTRIEGIPDLNPNPNPIPNPVPGTGTIVGTWVNANNIDERFIFNANLTGTYYLGNTILLFAYTVNGIQITLNYSYGGSEVIVYSGGSTLADGYGITFIRIA